MRSHYLRGGLTECLVISELLKQYYNSARAPHLYFWRDNHGNEIDCLIERGSRLFPIEIKGGRTLSSDYVAGLYYWNKLSNTPLEQSFVIYGGLENQRWQTIQIVSWRFIDIIFKRIYS